MLVYCVFELDHESLVVILEAYNTSSSRADLGYVDVGAREAIKCGEGSVHVDAVLRFMSDHAAGFAAMTEDIRSPIPS